MSCHPRVTEWTRTIHARLPHLSTPQATVLALWSLGMVLARSCALTAVSAFLATWLHRKEPAVRQQLREFCYEADRQARDDTVCARRGALLCAAAGLGRGPVGGHAIGPGSRCHDLGDPLYGLGAQRRLSGLCHPSSLTVLAATAKHAWRREWLRMLRQVRRAVPRAWTVIVLADRGLYARWLFRRITRLGWHPFLRINTGGTFRPTGQVRGVPLKTLVPEPGTTWQGTGIAFKGRHRQLHCTLLACWEGGYTDPWLILTDLPPEASTACWYGLRAWIEQGFKITKRAGWQWQRTHMTQPARAARLWLAVAVATLWLLSVGGEAEETIPASTVPDVTALVPEPPRTRRATRLRLVSVFRRGWNLILVALLDHAPLPLGRFVPEPWPAVPVPEEATPSLPVLALPRPLEAADGRSDRDMCEGKNMGIMTTLKKTYPRKGDNPPVAARPGYLSLYGHARRNRHYHAGGTPQPAPSRCAGHPLVAGQYPPGILHAAGQ